MVAAVALIPAAPAPAETAACMLSPSFKLNNFLGALLVQDAVATLTTLNGFAWLQLRPTTTAATDIVTGRLASGSESGAVATHGGRSDV